MRVSSLFNFVIALVGLVAIGFAFAQLRIAWIDLDSDVRAERFALSLQAAGRLRDALTVEQDGAEAALRTPRIDAAAAARLKAEPAATDAAVAAFRATLNQTPTPAGRDLAAGLEPIVRDLAAARGDAGRLAAQTQRDLTQLQAHADRMVALREQLGAMIDRLDLAVYSSRPENADLLVIAGLAEDMRRLAADRAAILTTLLASGQPALGDELDRFLALSGRIDELWSLLQRNVGRLGGRGNLQIALDKIAGDFFKTTDALYQPYLPVLRGMAATNPDLPGFRAKQAPALAAILTVRNMALDQLLAEARTAQAGSRVVLWAMIAASVAVIILVVGSAWYFRRRVINPLGSLTGSIEQLAAGDLSVEVGQAGRQDEIGAIGRALAVFRDNAVAARALEEQAADGRRRDAERQEADARREREAIEAERRREVEARAAEDQR
ncbi:MAG: HAMP domain-containing protein, partial [Ferrovibrionaceae bacterium]